MDFPRPSTDKLPNDQFYYRKISIPHPPWRSMLVWSISPLSSGLKRPCTKGPGRADATKTLNGIGNSSRKQQGQTQRRTLTLAHG